MTLLLSQLKKGAYEVYGGTIGLAGRLAKSALLASSG